MNMVKRAILGTVIIGVLVAAVCDVFAQTTEGMLLDLARIKEGVKSKRVSSFDRSGGNGDGRANIVPGETRTVFEVEGAGIINHIWITIGPPPELLDRHDIILRAYWDGNEEPCVESPIGDLFGQGWGESYPFSSMPLAAGPVEGRGLVSYFTMPFADGARIDITNEADKPIAAFYYYIDYVEVEKLPADMGRFHAWYNHQLTEALETGENEWRSLGPFEENTTGDRNYLILDAEGKGHYVGVNYFVHSPTPMWYGEGDDMFFIDGETWPSSLHGTGTEDYFNTSWCPKVLFQHPFYGYARVNDDIGHLGRTHVYRFHITDPIYFDKSLRFSIEHGHNNNLTLDISSVAYWYQTDPHKPFPEFPTKKERAARRMIGPVDIHRWRHEWRENQGADPTLWGKELRK
jgi:hypothetical protein